jgi:uncharacterized membrane protein
MAVITTFHYDPLEHERETASNSYVMSLVAIIAGMPIPILNLMATLIFYLGNRKGTYFVRWHCTQALVSQLLILVVNRIFFWWTISILFRDKEATDPYFAYLIIALLINLYEFIITLIAAINTRKGKHVEWWLFGSITDNIVKP